MANLPENLSYSPAVFKNLGNIKVPSPSVASSGSKTVTPPSQRYSVLTMRSENPNLAANVPEVKYNVTTESPLGELSETPTPATAAPSGYSDWSNPTQVPAGVRFATLSSVLGGGQFALPAQGQTATDAALHSERDNLYERAKYLPGMGGEFQVDHIMPLWLGGTNNEENKQVLSRKEHLQKTKVQEVVRSLYKNNVISKEEAQTYSLNWQNLPGWEDIDLTPVVSSNGAQTVDLKTAEKKLNEWRNPSANLGFWGSLKGIKENWGEAVKKVQGEVEKVAGKIIPPMTWDFMKGLTEGYTGNWIQGGQTNYENAPGYEKTAGKVARVAGSVVGSIAAFVTLTGLLRKGAGKIATRFAGTKLGGAATTAERILGTSGVKVGTSASQAQKGVLKLIAAERFWQPALRDVAVANVYGQLSRPNAGQSRMQRAFDDTVGALAMNVMPHTKYRYAAVPAVLGAAATYISTGDKETALESGLMFGGLFAAGVYGNNKSFIPTAMNIARQNAEDHLISITGRKLPAPPSSSASEAAKAAYKAAVEKEAMIAEDMVSRTAEMRPAGKETSKIDIDNYNEEIGRIKAAKAVLQGNVDLEKVGARGFEKSIMKDWEAFNKNESFGAYSEMPEITKRTPYETVEFVKNNPDVVELGEIKQTPLKGSKEAKELGLDDMEIKNFGKMQVTGLSSEISPQIAENVKTFNKKVFNGEISNEAYVSRNREAKYILDILNKQGKTQYNPDNAVIVWYFDPAERQIKILGMLPTKERIGEVTVGADGTPIVSGAEHSQNARIAQQNSGRAPEERYPYLDSNENNDEFVKELEKHGIQVMKVRTELPTDYGAGAGVGLVSGEPYFHISTTDNMWRDAKFRNRGITATPEEYLTRQALKSFENRIKTATGKAGSELPITMSDDEINAKFDHLLEIKKLSLPAAMTDMTPAEKFRLMEEYYAKATPRIAKAVVSYNKPAAKTTTKVILPPKTPQTPQQAKLPVAEVKTAVAQPQEATKSAKPQVVIAKAQAAQAPEAKAQVAQAPEAKAQAAQAEPAVKPAVEPAKAQAEKTTPKDYSTYDSETKINKGINKVVEQKYKELIQSGDRKGAVELRKEAKKAFSREGLRASAQEAFEESGGQSYHDGFSKFLNQTTQRIKDLTGDSKFEITPDETAVLHRQYNRLLQGHTRRAVFISTKNNTVKIAPSDADLMGEADARIFEYNSKNNLPKDAMEIIGIDKQSDFKKDYGGKMEPTERIYRINNDLKSIKNEKGKVEEFIPLGKTAKGEKSILAVKYEPSLVAKYSEAAHGGKNLSNRSKFLRVFAQDVLGLPKDISADDFVKRSPLIFQRYERYSGGKPNEKATIHIFKSKTVKEAGGVDESQFPDNPKSQEAKRIYGDSKEFDGKLVLGENLFDHLVESFNYDGKNRRALKPIIQGLVETEGSNGKLQYMVQKGHIIRADKAYRDYIKENYGLDFGKDEGVSFAENVKIGPTEGKVQVPLKNFFMKNLQYENESGIGPSFYSKFVDADNITKDIVAIDTANVKNLNELTEKLTKAKNKEEIEKVFADFKEKTGVDASDFTYGTKEKIYENGAGRKRFAQDFKKIIKNLFFDTVYKPKVEDSKMLFLTPSIKLKLDGPSKPARYLRSDEVAIGERYAKSAGIKDGDEVIVKREPANHISDYVYAKARIGDPMGATSLGDEHIMLSSHNTYVKVKGDHDGDPVAIFKIGEKFMPESIATAIKERGKFIIPISEASKRSKLDLTDENLLKVMSAQLIGDDQTGAIASMGRIVNLLKDNNAVIKIEGASTGGKSKYSIIVNGKVVDSGTTSKIKDTIYAKLDWNDNTDQLKQQIAQYSLDSKSSDDIIRSTATVEYPDGGDPLFMLKNSFIVKNQEGNILNPNKKETTDRMAKSLSGALRSYQDIFNAAQPDVISEMRSLTGAQKSAISSLGKSIEVAQKIKTAGGKLHPTQERLLAFGDLKDIPFDEADFLVGDTAGKMAVVNQLADKIKDPSPAAQEIITKAQQARVKYNNIWRDKNIVPSAKKAARDSTRKEVVDLYEKYLEEGKLSENDLDALAYWTIVNPAGDIAWDPKSTRKYVYRYDEFVGNSPEVSKVYYKAYEDAPLASENKASDVISSDELEEIARQGAELQ